MKRVNLLAILILIMAAPLLAAEEVKLTLDEAIVIGLRENRDILLKSEDVKYAQAKIREAESSLMPTLNFTGGWTYTRDFYPKDIGQTTTQTTLKQYLYKGGKTINTIRLNKNKFEVAKSLLDQEKNETVLDIKKAFYALLLSGELVSLNKIILDNTEEHLDLIAERYRKGLFSQTEVLQIKSSLNSVREAYESSKNESESLREILANLLFLEKDVSLKPEGEFIYEPRDLAIDEAVLKALRNRPEIKQYAAQEKGDLAAIEIAKSDSRPNIYASWDYYSRSTASLTFSPGRAWNDYNILGFTFTWPIFDGFAAKHKVQQAIVDLKETQLLKEKLIKDIALELREAYLSLKNAIAKISSTESDLIFYSDNLNAIQEKYQEGIASFLDKSDALVKYNISLYNKKQAIYDYLIAKSSFDKAMGGF